MNIVKMSNIAELKTRAGTPGARVDVSGYYTNNDGGGGVFYWDENSVVADNAGTVIQKTGLTTGRWIRLFSGSVNVKWFGAKGTLDTSNDDTVAFQRAVNTGFHVFVPAGEYYLSAPITNPSIATEHLDISGEYFRSTRINAKAGFTGYMLKPSKSYNIQDVTIIGILGQSGVYGIGCNDVNSQGTAILKRVAVYYTDEAISFGGEYEHSIGLTYEDIYVQFFLNAGINLGGITGTASSGESNFALTRIAVTNAAMLPTVYASSVSVDTPNSTTDRITWTGTVPPYGFLVLRSANGTTNWHVPPNWNTIYGFTSLTFDATKVAAETWTYKVVRNTIGINVRRAKAIFGGSIQSEYSGVGQVYNDITGGCIDAVYYENRDPISSPYNPNPSLAGMAFIGVNGMSVNSGFIDKSSYGIIANNNSKVSLGNIRFINTQLFPTATFAAGTDTYIKSGNFIFSTSSDYKSVALSAFDYNWNKDIYSSSRLEQLLSHTTEVKRANGFRGIEKSIWRTNNTTGSTLEGFNSIVVSPFSKTTLTPPLQGNTALTTALVNTVSTHFLTIPVEANRGASLMFFYTATVVSTNVRQVITGMLFITAVRVSTAAPVVSITDVGQTKSLDGASTLTLTFSVATSSNNIDVSAVSTSSYAVNATIVITPVGLTGYAAAPAIVQL